MEGATDPDLMRDRALFRFGIFVHKNQRVVIITSLLLGIILASLLTIGPKWAESWGEEDVEAINAGKLLSEIQGNSDNPPTSSILFHSESWSYYDSSTSQELSLIHI